MDLDKPTVNRQESKEFKKAAVFSWSTLFSFRLLVVWMYSLQQSDI